MRAAARRGREGHQQSTNTRVTTTMALNIFAMFTLPDLLSPQASSANNGCGGWNECRSYYLSTEPVSKVRERMLLVPCAMYRSRCTFVLHKLRPLFEVSFNSKLVALRRVGVLRNLTKPPLKINVMVHTRARLAKLISTTRPCRRWRAQRHKKRRQSPSIYFPCARSVYVIKRN